MADSSLPPIELLLPPPTADEAEALVVAARYFVRAGTRIASLLLGGWSAVPDYPLCAALRDSLLPGAVLLEGLRDLTVPDGAGS